MSALRVPEVLLFRLQARTRKQKHRFPASPCRSITSPNCCIHWLGNAAFKDPVALSALLLPGQPRQTRGFGRSAGAVSFLHFLTLSHTHTQRNHHLSLEPLVGLGAEMVLK